MSGEWSIVFELKILDFVCFYVACCAVQCNVAMYCT